MKNLTGFQKAAAVTAIVVTTATASGCASIGNAVIGEENTAKIGKIKDNAYKKADDATGGRLSSGADKVRGGIGSVLDSGVNATGSKPTKATFSEAVKADQADLIEEGCMPALNSKGQSNADGLSGAGHRAAIAKRESGTCTPGM